MNTIKIELVELERILRLKDTDVGRLFRDSFRYITEHTVPKYGSGSELLQFVFEDFKLSLDKQMASADLRSMQNRQNAIGKGKSSAIRKNKRIGKTKSDSDHLAEDQSDSQQLDECCNAPMPDASKPGEEHRQGQIAADSTTLERNSLASIPFEQFEAIYPKKDSSATYRNEAKGIWQSLSDEKKRHIFGYVSDAVAQGSGSSLPFLFQYLKSEA